MNAKDRTSQSFVKKKAALTLLRLYRKHPDIIPAAEWALRIVSLMDDDDLVSSKTHLFKPTQEHIYSGCCDLCDKLSDGVSTGSSRSFRCLLY
jgi:hypothetical protein